MAPVNFQNQSERGKQSTLECSFDPREKHLQPQILQNWIPSSNFTALTVSMATSILSISMTASLMAWEASGSLSWEMSFLTVCSSCWRRTLSPGSFRVDLRLGRMRQRRSRMFTTGSYRRGETCNNLCKLGVHVF